MSGQELRYTEPKFMVIAIVPKSIGKDREY